MKFLLVSVLSAQVLFGLGSCSAAVDPPGSGEAATTPVVLCSAREAFEIDQAQKVRDELSRRPPPPTRRLTQIAEALNDAASCTMNLSPPSAEMAGTLYVLLGNAYLSREDYPSASRAYEEAGQYYSRLKFPSLMWLEALRGEARAQVRMGDLPSADRAASRQSELASSWVEKGFVRAALVDALRFQAQVYDREGKSGLGSALRGKADRLEAESGPTANR